MSASPKISIVSAMDDHPADIDAFFSALSAQTVAAEAYEVLVVDSCHAVDIGPAYERFLSGSRNRGNVAYIKIDAGGRAKAHNHGIANSVGEIVLFFGSDFVAPPNLVEAHLNFHELNQEPHFVGIGQGLISDNQRRSHFARWLEESGELFGIPFSKDLTAVPEDYFYCANTSVKRSLLQSAGPFDERYPYDAWDDYDMGVRLRDLGMVARYVPNVNALHDHELTISTRRDTMALAGESAVIFESGRPGVYPWQAKCAVPPWRHELAGCAWRLRYLVSGDEQDLINHYRYSLNAGFVRGYRQAKSRDTSAGRKCAAAR